MATKAYFENIKEKIIGHLCSSNKSIKVAVAWLTDADLFEILCEKAQSGLRVELLLANDETNHNSNIDYKKLTSCGGKVYFVGEGNDFEPIMHHKFCIVDNYTLIFGSYNWTNKAKSNHENITIIDNDANIILDYNDEFERLRYYVQQNNLKNFIKNKKNQTGKEKFIEWVLSDKIILGEYIRNISKNFPITDSILEKYCEILDFGWLSSNSKINFTIELLNKYENNWEWKYLIYNPSLPKSSQSIKKLNSILLWNSDGIRDNKNISLAEYLIEIYKNELPWIEISFSNSFFPWNENLIKRYRAKWDWKYLSNNSEIKWDSTLIDNHKDEMDWGCLSSNKYINWTIELIEQFENYWVWSALSYNPALPWSKELITKYKYRWSRENLSSNIGLSWQSENLIDTFLWESESLSRNTSLPWSVKFIEENKKLINFNSLSKNPNIPWTFDFIEKYEQILNWENLSNNLSLPWTIELIEKYKDKWSWECLSGNPSLPWSSQFIEKYEDKWTWKAKSVYKIHKSIGKNSGIPWDVNLIDKYKDKINWWEISINIGMCDVGLIDTFKDKWYWGGDHESGTGLTKHLNKIWTFDLIERFKEKLIWSEVDFNIIFEEFVDIDVVETILSRTKSLK